MNDKIEDAFECSAEIDARRVYVEVYDVKVILNDNVRSWAEREEAQQAVWSAQGVTEIVNHLTIAMAP